MELLLLLEPSGFSCSEPLASWLSLYPHLDLATHLPHQLTKHNPTLTECYRLIAQCLKNSTIHIKFQPHTLSRVLYYMPLIINCIIKEVNNKKLEENRLVTRFTEPCKEITYKFDGLIAGFIWDEKGLVWKILMNHQPFVKLFQHQFYALYNKIIPNGSCAVWGNFLIRVEVGRWYENDNNKIFLTCKSVPCYLMTNPSKHSHIKYFLKNIQY